MTRNHLALLIVFAGSLSIYLLTLAPDITWAHTGNDGGDLITAAVTLGVPHPSGYPTYSLTSKLFSLVPIGTIAWRFNLFSALAMALAATLVTNARLSVDDDAPRDSLILAVATGLTFAFVPGIWKQAVITEVYALNLLMLALLLLALQRRWRTSLIGLLWGVSITTHLTSLLLFPLIIFNIRPKQWQRFCLFVPLGLLPLFAPAIFARGNSPVVWGNPTTLDGWWWLISGRIYRPNVLSFSHLLPHLRESILPFLQQFSYIGWLLLAIGLVRVLQADRWDIATRIQLGGAATALLYAVYALTYDAFDYPVFALPAALLLTPLLYEGLKPLRFLALALPILAVALHFQTVSVHGDFSVRERAESGLALVSAEAIVITPGDQSLFTLWYLHYVENQRPDIVPIDSNMLAFDWYRERLARLYPELQNLEIDDLVQFKQANRRLRSVCDFSIDPVVEVQCKSGDGQTGLP